jgi:hypothetical protein
MPSGIDDDEIDALLKQAATQWAAQNSSRSSDQSCFDTGISFHVAALKCALPESTDGGGIFAPTSPVICCLAFACELYLKALLISRNRPSRGHKLQLLFNALDKSDIRGIGVQYAQLTGRRRSLLIKDIILVSNAFVEWRYIFEAGTVTLSPTRLSNIALAVYEHIRLSRAEWLVTKNLDTKVRTPLAEDVALTLAIGGGRMVRAVRR